MTIVQVKVKKTQTCPSCRRRLQGAGHVIQFKGRSSDPICGWCAEIVNSTGESGELICLEGK